MDPEYSGEGASHKKVSKYIYKWTIHDFNCPDVSDAVYYPEIKFPFTLCLGNLNIDFVGTLAISGNTCHQRGVHMHLESTNSKTWKVQCAIRSGNRNYIMRDLHNKNTNLWLNLYEKDNCLLLPGNNVITCVIAVVHYESKQFSTVQVKTSEVLQDFARLLETKKFSDVTLEVAGKEFHAHKNILSCRSPVFDAMFEHQMQEATSNKVFIEDIEPEVFQEILRFIYTDSVSKLKQMTTKLLAASDKYDLARLRSMCEIEIANHISVKNAAEVLVIADLHKADELKKIAKSFIDNNLRAVAASNGWKVILENRNLLAEIFPACFK